MKYAYTILYVENVEASIQFYTDAFGFEKKFITPEKDYGELISGATCIAFAQHQLAASNFKEAYQKVGNKKIWGFELGLVSEDVQASLDKALRAGAILVESLKTKPWGQEVAYVKDHNGFLIEICSPVQS